MYYTCITRAVNCVLIYCVTVGLVLTEFLKRYDAISERYKSEKDKCTRQVRESLSSSPKKTNCFCVNF